MLLHYFFLVNYQGLRVFSKKSPNEFVLRLPSNNLMKLDCQNGKHKSPGPSGPGSVLVHLEKYKKLCTSRLCISSVQESKFSDVLEVHTR